MIRFLAHASLCWLLFAGSVALGLDADGPDTFRVVGVSPGGNLNLRAEPSTGAEIVGQIPAGTDGLVNLGCEGGLSFAEWQVASEAERAASGRNRWCKVRFRGSEGYVAGRFLAEGTIAAPAAAVAAAGSGPQVPAEESASVEDLAGPASDCARAEGAIEERICRDPRLAGLDREVTRLYLLAARDPAASSERRRALVASQRAWMRDRDACWSGDLDLDTCAESQYALRAHELRTRYAATRAGEGTSSGPFAYQCEGLDPVISATFLAGEAELAALEWEGREAVLFRVPSASGAKYQSDAMADLNNDGAPEDATVFWTKGEEAIFSLIGSSEMPCRQVAGG